MNILSLPNEIIAEISNNIILPADIVRFSLVCRDFYNCICLWKINWFTSMRSVIKEINLIEYTIADRFPNICTDYDDLKPKSCRRRDRITTYSYYIPVINQRYGKNLYKDILHVHQSKPIIKSRKCDDEYMSEERSKYEKFIAALDAHNRVCISWRDTYIGFEKSANGKYKTCRGITVMLYH